MYNMYKYVLFLFVLIIGAFFVLTSCNDVFDNTDSTIVKELSSDDMREMIIKMGFREDMIEEQETYFIVEGDIAISKASLKNSSSRQYHTHGIVSRSNVTNITIRVDNSIPASGTDNWRPAVQNAVNDWNSITNCILRFQYTTASTADITVSSDGGSLPWYAIAMASWPSGGNPGPTIVINLDFNSNMTVSEGRKRYNMVHEMGHCIGFRHTNWSAQGEPANPLGANHIYGTPTTDANSVMNGGTALNTWQGFSGGDIVGAQMLYWRNFLPGVGHLGEGAGVAVGHIGGNSRPDMVLMAYDAPSGANNFRYRIAWDLATNGIARSLSGYKYVSGVGHIGDGAGIAIANIGGTSRPDLILMAYDAPSGANNFRYKIGYDLNTSGNASWWSGYKQVTGVGYVGEGAGIAIGNIGGSSRPDMVIMAYDAPSGANTFRYRIGYDLNTSGNASSWSGYKQVAGVGHVGEGAGVAITNIGGSSRPDLILMAYDAPSGHNYFRYRVGYDLNTSGNASWWSGYKNISGLGHLGEGAGVAIANIGGSSRPDIILMAYDAPGGPNYFRYRFGRDLNTSGNAYYLF